MKKGFFIFLSILFMQISAFAFENSVKFIQVTDVHYSGNNEYSNEVLKNAVKSINSQQDIDFVVFTGDNIDQASREDLAKFIKIVNKVHVPYYIVLGNHDVFKGKDLSKEQYSEVIRQNNFKWYRRKWDYAFKKNGFVFLVLDGAKEVIPGPGGYYRERTLLWFDKMLSKYSKKPVIVFQHFPVLDSPRFGAGRIKTHKVYQAEKYWDILKKHDNVVAILAGHYHVNSEIMQDGVYHINTPTLMTDPPCYKIVEIIAKKDISPIIYTQLIYIE